MNDYDRYFPLLLALGGICVGFVLGVTLRHFGVMP